MNLGNEKESLPRLHVPRILSFLSPDWLPLVLETYKTIRQLLRRGLHEGLYEVLEYDSVLELVEPNGEIALFKKRHRVKFLQDNVIAYQDYAWGDGDVSVDYRCSPGVVVDRYREGNRWNVLISLRETKSSGAIEDFFIEREIKHGFTKNEEWWQIAMQHQAKRLKLSIIFPKERRCERAALVERLSDRTTHLGPEHFADLPDGRQALTWENTKPRQFETYTFKWWW